MGSKNSHKVHGPDTAYNTFNGEFNNLFKKKIPIFAGYGTSLHAGSKLIKYGLELFVILPAKRLVNEVLPAPAIPGNKFKIFM